MRHRRVNSGVGIPVYLYGATNGFAAARGCDSCWAGCGNTAAGWRVATASYFQPALAASRCDTGTAVFWAGIGGDGNDKMGQTGTASGENGWPAGSAWVETDPRHNAPFQFPGNPVAAPGTHVYASTAYSDSRYQFTIRLGTHTFTMGYQGSWTRADATAEAIAEHVVGTRIANFGTVRMIALNGRHYSPVQDHPHKRWTTWGIAVSPLLDAGFRIRQTDCLGSAVGQTTAAGTVAGP